MYKRNSNILKIFTTQKNFHLDSQRFYKILSLDNSHFKTLQENYQLLPLIEQLQEC